MSDRWAVLLALATAVGALAARPLSPVWVAVAAALGIAALVRRAPAALCLAAALAGSGLAARAWDGLAPPARSSFSGLVLIATDPAPERGGAVRFEARLGSRRVEAWARGDPARRLAQRMAGERVQVGGWLRPVTGRRQAYLAHRHIAGRLDVRTVDQVLPASAPYRAANAVRRTILHGARVLPGQSRALFGGFVLGDQRGESEETKDAFRRSGLSHLLVVSGSNVAFVLALAHPLLRRMRIAPRFLAACAVLAFFALLTRGEPSVLRAAVMATLALYAATLGRPTTTQRVLCLTVTALLLIDPLLVGSVGFLLSVAATAGIAWLTPTFRRWLPLPLAVTAAAQVGVSPVAIPLFGGVPIVSLLANLLALPAAAPVMMWGLAAGLPAGLLPAPLAAVVHLPTRLLVGWISFVAHRTSASPLADVSLGAPALCGLAAAVFVGRAGWRIASRRAARARSP